MKILAFSTLIIVGTLGHLAFAEEVAEHREGPCNKIMEACKEAGFSKNAKKGTKSLYRDCLQPLLIGDKVENVKYTDDDLKACQAKKAELKSKK